MEFVYSDKNPQSPVAYVSFGAMHTVLEAVLTGIGKAEARRTADAIGQLVSTIESRIDRHDEKSFFARINASQGGGPVELDEETYVILQLCEVFRQTTCGYFDIAALSERRAVPAYTLDPATRSVTLAGKGIRLDAGAFGKGYALDRVKKSLSEAGVTNALVNFGDSSVTALGSHPYGDCWQVSPAAGGRTFRLSESALSLSGPSPDGRAHIIDPLRGEPVANTGLVAVEGRSALVCEILSTALYAAPDGARQRIAAAFEGYRPTEIKQDTQLWTDENF